MRPRLPRAAVLLMCALSACGEDPTVADTGSDTTAATLSGFVTVTVTTSGGAIDVDGYDLAVDDADRLHIARPDSGTGTVEVASGRRRVALRGVQANCSVEGNDRLVDVPAGKIVAVRFAVTCASGDVRVTLTLSGENADTTGVTVLLTPAAGRELGLPYRGSTLEFPGVPTGTLALRLAGISGNCREDAAADGYPVAGAAVTDIRVDVECRPIGSRGLVLSDGQLLYRFDESWRAPVEIGRGANPNWSPDGQLIAFEGQVLNTDDAFPLSPYRPAPFTMTAMGREVRQLSSRGEKPRFLPDGRIVDSYGTYQPSGAGVTGRPWSFENDYVQVVDWSSDASRLLVRRRALDGVSRDTLALAAADGTTLSVLLTTPGSVNCARLSPDGRWVAVSVYYRDGFDGSASAGIWVVEMGTGAARRVADPVSALSDPLGGGGPYDIAPVIWSPDGERLLTIREGNDGGFALWTFRRDGGDLRRLWSGPGYWTADWR